MDWLDDVKKINQFGDFLNVNEHGEIKDYISTGSLSVNSIITGSLFKGIPAGRITSLEGESGVGKSFVAGKVVAEAQKKGYSVIWFDSENATDKFFLERLGVDISKVLYMPVVTVEEFRNQTLKILEVLEEKQKKDKDLKLIVVLDSLGNLITNAEITKISEEENYTAQDMGQKSKIVKSMTRALTGIVGRTGTPVLIINHGQWTREANPKIPPKFNPTGGLGIVYISHVRLFLTKSIMKDDEKNLVGNNLRVETKKNRLVPEGKKAQMQVNFETGIDKYFGLLDYAEAAGLIVKEGTRYYVKHLDKKFFGVNMYTAEVFEPMLNDIDAYLQAHCKFSSVSDNILEEVNKVEEPVEEVEEKKTRKYTKKK